MIDLRKLRMLEALERLGTVAAVADELRLTAPGISMQLRALERELSLGLTERRGRRLALTPAGRMLAAHGRDVLARLSLAEIDADALRHGAAGTYRLAAFPSAARTFVADAWRALIEGGATLDLRLTTPEPEGALAALVAGETDLALVHDYSNVPRRLPDGIEAAPIASEPVWLAIRRDDPAAARVIDLAGLADHRWIVPVPGLTCHEMTERACGLAGFRPRVAAQSMDFAAQLALVAAGAGVALVPSLAAHPVPQGVCLAALAAPVTRHIHAARRTTMHGDPGLDRLTAVLAEAAESQVRRYPATA